MNYVRSRETSQSGVQQLPDDVKEKLFYFIDMTVRDYKAKQAYK